MYTKTKEKSAEPPNVKYYQYFILFMITILSMFFIAQSTNNSNYFISKNSFGGGYLSALNVKNKPFKVNQTNNLEGIVVFNLEDNDYTSEKSFSEMTKSEIYEYQDSIKYKIENYEELNLASNYVDLQKQLENSQYILENGKYKYPYSQTDLNTVAYAIYREAGSYWLKDRHRDLVGCVIRNRKNQGGINQDLTNPSYEDILDEEGQYPYKAKDVNTEVIPDYCYESAVRVLEYKVDCPDSIIWQATFKQGSGVYEKFYDDVLGTTTYFCKK